MDNKVNIDFISCVHQLNDGTLEYKELPIATPNADVLAAMCSMVDNPNRTVIDLQEYSDRLIHSGETHNTLCFPHEYSASFISGPEFPKPMSFSEYQKECAERKKFFEEEKKEKEKEGKQFDAEEAFRTFVHNLKENYYLRIKSYINADQFVAELSRIKAREGYLMYSSENIGWTIFNYPISDNIKFEVKTNFGYGRSAYFYVNLTYKGIKIIPYSDIVRYFYANMSQFGQYTRQYRARHESWPISFNFVVETANLAFKDSEEFVKTWIKNELNEMMEGFRKLKTDAKGVISSFANNSNKMAENYISVRNMQGTDQIKFKVYPDEMSVAYKAYKISGALRLLDNLKELAEIYDFVSDAIKELKDINLSLLPEIEETLKGIIASINTLETKIAKLEEEEATLNNQIDPYEESLNKLLEKANILQHFAIKSQFKQMNPKYVELINRRQSVREDINRNKRTIYEREQFKDSLEQSEQLINEIILVA
jgi:hypothetical protein